MTQSTKFPDVEAIEEIHYGLDRLPTTCFTCGVTTTSEEHQCGMLGGMYLKEWKAEIDRRDQIISTNADVYRDQCAYIKILESSWCFRIKRFFNMEPKP